MSAENFEALVQRAAATYWWKEGERTKHEAVFQAVRRIEENQSYRTKENLRHARLYGNMEFMGLTPGTYARSKTSTSDSERLRYNLCQSVVDTLASKIAKNKPKPMFLTSGGDFTLQRKAKLLDKFSLGQFYATNIYTKGRRVFRDAAVLGTGHIKTFEMRGKIYSQRVLTSEILVDDADAFYGEPRQLFQQKKTIPREILLALYPGKAKAIRDAPRCIDEAGLTQSLADLVEVVEAWHLQSGPEAGDGKWGMFIETATLESDEWTEEDFPFSTLRFNERMAGYYGQGAVEQVKPQQIEVNRTLQVIQKSLKIMGVPRVWIEANSQVVASHITNEIGAIGYYTGTPPQMGQFGTVIAPELFKHLADTINRAFEQCGVSQMSAQSKKPAGIDTAVGMRTLNDIESERFMLLGQDFEEFYMDIARKQVKLARRIHERDGKFSVTVRQKRFLETIDWKDVDLADDQYQLQVYPTALLPTEPAGRRQAVQEMITAGLIDTDQGRELLDYPDLEKFMSLTSSGNDTIDEIAELMLAKGEFVPPDAFMPLERAIPRVNMHYLRARLDRAPDERLELLRKWITQASAIKNKATQPAQAAAVQPPQPAMPPVAPPMAPPVAA